MWEQREVTVVGSFQKGHLREHICKKFGASDHNKCSCGMGRGKHHMI